MTKQINKPTELTTTTMMHGGAREGAGRMPLGTKPVMIRLTPVQQSILSSLGGSKYIREEVLGRLAELAEDLARDTIVEAEGDFQSALDSMCGESIEGVVEKLPAELSETERKAVIETASWLLEKERDEVGGNLYEVYGCYNRDLGYDDFEFRAQNDEEAYKILDARWSADDRRAYKIVEEADKKARTVAEQRAVSDLRSTLEDAPCYINRVRRVAIFKGERIDEFDIEY